MSVNVHDPDALATSLHPELVLTTWTPVTPPAGIEAAWHGDGGEELTVFPPEQRSAHELLGADAAALLSSGTFVPGQPMREGDRLQGSVTSSTRGPQLLDTIAVTNDEGTRRVVLLRPAGARP